MMRRTAILAGAAVAAFFAFDAPQLTAQEMPDFSGSWTMVEDPDAAPPTGGRGGRGGRGGGGFLALGQSVTIAQTESTLSITRTTGGRGGGGGTEVTSTYNLDGSESTNSLTMGRGGAIEQVSTAVWSEGKLTITTSMAFGGNPFETTMALSLNTEGNLVVESTNPGRGGGPTTTTSTYTKGG